MKCVCGHEGTTGINEKDFIADRKIFLKLSSTLQVEFKKYYMYICPKCGSIKIDLDKKENKGEGK